MVTITPASAPGDGGGPGQLAVLQVLQAQIDGQLQVAPGRTGSTTPMSRTASPCRSLM
jgi:hypothetical protein